MAGSSPLSRGIRGSWKRLNRGGGIIPALAGNTELGRCFIERSQDHPRSRGEYSGANGIGTIAQGSSPLSRGIQFHFHDVFELLRIIPALAGNTGGLRPQEARPADHPRSRGEYVLPPRASSS